MKKNKIDTQKLCVHHYLVHYWLESGNLYEMGKKFNVCTFFTEGLHSFISVIARGM